MRRRQPEEMLHVSVGNHHSGGTVTATQSSTCFIPSSCTLIRSEIKGTVAPGWAHVRAAFELNFAANEEQCAQLSVYRRGIRVVNVSGRSSSSATTAYDIESLQNIFSCAQNLEAICVMMLIDRGLLHYDELVATYWPDFGKHGKEVVTITDVLRHESGLAFLADPSNPENAELDAKLSYDDIKDVESMERKIENAVRYTARKGHNNEGYRRYSAISRGFIVSGIIRRVDPDHRTLGVFMREEICRLMNLEIHCGLSQANQWRRHIADSVEPSQLGLFFNVLLPSLFGLEDPASLASYKLKSSEVWQRSFSGLLQDGVVTSDGFVNWLNRPEIRALEIPSIQMLASAQSLAKLGASLLMALDPGNSSSLVSRKTLQLALSEPIAAYDNSLSSPTCFTKGGFGYFGSKNVGASPTTLAAEGSEGSPLMEGSPLLEGSPLYSQVFKDTCEGFYGWMGGPGSSLLLFEPKQDIVVAYTATKLSHRLMGGQTSDRIMQAVVHCLNSN